MPKQNNFSSGTKKIHNFLASLYKRYISPITKKIDVFVFELRCFLFLVALQVNIKFHVSYFL